MEENKKIPEKKIKPVATAKVKKKTELQKLASTFITEDLDTVKNFAIQDVMIPSIKKAIVDIVTNGINMFMYGETKKSSDAPWSSKVSYTGYYKDSGNNTTQRVERRYSDGFDYDRFSFKTRGEAEMVLSSMDDILDRFGSVSVGDFYDLSGVSTDNYAVYKYGWKDLQSARVEYRYDGYVIRLPKATLLN